MQKTIYIIYICFKRTPNAECSSCSHETVSVSSVHDIVRTDSPMFKKQNRKQIFIHCLIKYLLCAGCTPDPAGSGSQQTTRSLPSWTCLLMTWTLNKEDATKKHTVTTCSVGYGGKEQSRLT